MTNPSAGEPTGYEVLVELESAEATSGAEKALSLPDGRTFTIRTPPGVTDNMLLRLPGADQADPQAPRDIFLRVRLKPASDAPLPGPFAPVPPAGGFGPPTGGYGMPPVSGPPTGGFAPPMSGPPVSGPPTSGMGMPPTSGFEAPPTAGFGAPPMPGFGAPPTGGFGAPPPSGFGAPPTSGFGSPPVSGPPTGGFAAPGYPATGPVTGPPTGPWPAPTPAPSKRGKLIALIAGAAVLVLLVCGGTIALVATSGNGKDKKGGSTANGTTGPTSAASPSAPPMTPEAYTQLLGNVDAAITPAVQKALTGRTPTAISDAADALYTTTMTEVSELDKASPPAE